MLKRIHIEEALKFRDCVFIDVRSPKEYNEATIPGAVNIPIFDNTERELIGRIYHNINKQCAMEKGLEIASSKLVDIYRAFKSYSEKYQNIAVFCWRGGMRSRAVTTILDLMKLPNVHYIIGGYKSYRKHVVNFFENLSLNFKLVVIHGMTGVGKTKVLKILEEQGYPVIDLEDMAGHRGSVFGGIGISQETSQKMFEAFLMNKILSIQRPYALVESESSRIGNKIIPKKFVKEMRKGVHMMLTAPLDIRVKRVVEEYVKKNADFDIEEVKKGLMEIRNRLGAQKYKNLAALLEKGEFEQVIEVLLKDYYDPRYRHSSKSYKFDIEIDASNLQKGVNAVKNYLKENFDKIFWN